MEDNLKKSADEITLLFRGIAKKFRKYVVSQLEECNFTHPQFILLNALYTHPGINLKELSDIMGLSKSTVCGIVDRLEAQGSLVRSQDENDRRAVRIYLTPETLEMQETMKAIKENYLAQILRKADAEDIQTLISSLKKFNDLFLEEK